MEYLRKTFTTTIDEEIQNSFKYSCKMNNVKMNDILEVLMNAYSKKEIKIELKTSYKVVGIEKE